MNNLDIKREIYKRSYALINSMRHEIGKDFQSTSSGVFVGHYGYPNVNAGVLSSVEKPGRFYDVMSALMERAKIINSKRKANVNRPPDFRELALSERPVDVEIFLRSSPKFHLNLSKFTRPIIVSADMERFKVVENPRIRRSVEKIVDDDLSAHDAVIELAKRTDVEKISTILSAGLLGKKKKIVPTRWSITATDDIVSKRNIERIKGFPELNEFRVFHGTFFENEFVVILYPHHWSFEMIESWGAEPSVDYELYHGRKDYARQIEGAYYAARLSVTNYLISLKRQAACSVLRLVHKGYFAPLGVWVIRDGVRSSLAQYTKFSTLNELMKFVRENYGFRGFFEKSHIIPELSQKKLNSFV